MTKAHRSGDSLLYKRITSQASPGGLIVTGAGTLAGVLVSWNTDAASSIDIIDGTTAYGTKIAAMSLVYVSGVNNPAYYPLNVGFTTGCYLGLHGSTTEATAFYIY